MVLCRAAAPIGLCGAVILVFEGHVAGLAGDEA